MVYLHKNMGMVEWKYEISYWTSQYAYQVSQSRLIWDIAQSFYKACTNFLRKAASEWFCHSLQLSLGFIRTRSCFPRRRQRTLCVCTDVHIYVLPIESCLVASVSVYRVYDQIWRVWKVKIVCLSVNAEIYVDLQQLTFSYNLTFA